MKILKTAEDYWNNGKIMVTDWREEDFYVMPQSNFYAALAEDRQQIKDMIDEMIEEHGLEGDLYYQALTELLEILKEKQ